ncbi:MAG: O-antigen ligase family protein [bacterium]|nr:O-antigen ligase family protein [bacterium]MDZ4346855.1 O-antigen ligase family protein [Candidatus Binatia bacterium]
MVISAFSSSYLSLILPLGVIGTLIAAWAVRLPRLAIWLLCLSLVAGQAIRLPLPGQGGGLLLSDLATVMVIFAAVGYALTCPRQNAYYLLHTTYYYLLLFSPFLLWSLWTLLINAPQLGVINTFIAAAYWVRLSVVLLLLPALLVLLDNPKNKLALKQAVNIVLISLTMLGFLQLLIVPNLGVLHQSWLTGWDPHAGRLVSTWLDPNFVGAAFAVGIFFVFAPTSPPDSPKQGFNKKNILMAALLFVAMILTKSRSSFLALLLTVLVLLPFMLLNNLKRPSARQTIILAATVGLLITGAILAAIILGDRAIGLISFDDTVSLRQNALTSAWGLAASHPIVGVGYNAYQFAAQKAGLISDYSVHSRAGTDNSLLTLWITTGLPGVALFFAPWLFLFNKSLLYWWRDNQPVFLATAASILLLFIHSQFINSFLYSHLLIFLIMIIALSLSPKTPREPKLEIKN